MGDDALVALAERLQAASLAGGATVALAESCTGGMVATALTAVPGSSGYFLGGVLIIESVFGLPGVGQLAYHAIATLDVPMITGTVLVAAVFVVLMNFAVDVTYTLVDPRVRLSRR